MGIEDVSGVRAAGRFGIEHEVFRFTRMEYVCSA